VDVSSASNLSIYSPESIDIFSSKEVKISAVGTMEIMAQYLSSSSGGKYSMISGGKTKYDYAEDKVNFYYSICSGDCGKINISGLDKLESVYGGTIGFGSGFELGGDGAYLSGKNSDIEGGATINCNYIDISGHGVVSIKETDRTNQQPAKYSLAIGRGFLTEDEWKKIIAYLYNSEDAKVIEEKVNEVIQKKFFKSKLDTDRKLTREEIIQISRMKEEYNIPLKDLVKILHEFQIRLREKYLKNFVILFKNVDKDNNGIINEEEFVSLLYNMNIFGDQLKVKIVELLTEIDPFNNKQITFSECVNLFGNTPYYPDGSSETKGSILDKICLGDNII
jgi:Ca2+-binding EF-hand superfamily protein